MEPKAKVCYVITKSNWGGAQRYVYDLATSLPDDYEPVVVVGGEGELVTKLEQAGIRVIKLKNLGRDISLLNDWRSGRQLLKIFRAEKPEIVHLNSPKAAGLGAHAAWHAGVPKIIYTAHGWTFNENIPLFKRLVIKFFSWLTIILSTKVIVISHSEWGQVASWPFVAKKLHLIYNGIAPAHWPGRDAARAELLRRLRVPSDFLDNKTVVGTIAELHRNKGLTYAIEAMPRLNLDMVYVIVGEGEERRGLEKLIATKNLGDRVFLLGFVPAATILPAFDLFLLPSIKEGLPYVILEAGQAGLPVIATRVGGIPEIIEDGVSGLLIKPADPDDLVQSLKKLIKLPAATCTEMGYQLAAKVRQQFSAERMVKETTVVYGEPRF